MRCSISLGTVFVTACLSLATARACVGQPIAATIELQSGPLTPGLMLKECPRVVHRVRILIDELRQRGTLVLDSNDPEFD